MRFNFPSTLTSKEVKVLFVFFFLKATGAEAGQSFYNCLTYNKVGAFYDELLNFPFSNSSELSLCCDSIQCYSVPVTSICPSNNIWFPCNKFSQTIVCNYFVASSNGNNKWMCSGIIGNKQITTNTTLGNCIGNINTVANYLTNANISTNNGFARLVCPNLNPCFPDLNLDGCWWDNEGWICQSFNGSNYFDYKDNCFLQWSAPWPGSNSLTSSSTTSSNYLATSAYSFPDNFPSDNSQLTKTIAIVVPVASITGVASIGGITYYVIRKRRGKKNQISRWKKKKSYGLASTSKRNILIIGRTGGGKSALANVIGGTNKFAEGTSSISITQDIQVETFEHEGIKYRIIDTVAIDDTLLSRKEVLNKMTEATYFIEDGLNQIFFATSGRLTRGEVEVYQLLKSIIFDENIAKFITIVRTHFRDFKDQQKCQRDKEMIIKEDKELAQIINECNEIIYVDNPPIDVENKFAEELNKETRDFSREKLLEYLANCQNVYRPKNLKNSLLLSKGTKENQGIELDTPMKLLIKKELEKKGEEIEKITFFKTWFNENCTLIISKKENKLTRSSEHGLWIVLYEPVFRKINADIKLIKVIKRFSKLRKNWEKIIEDFKNRLEESDYPATEIYNSPYAFEFPPLIQDYPNITKRRVKISSQFDPDDYIRPYDIIKRRINGLVTMHHYAIYLGNRQVVHISGQHGQKEIIDETNCSRVDSWESFLKDAKEIEIHHPVVPFKKPELIREHIDIAVKAGYGKGQYHILKENCEHFVTMCVYGLGMSQQKNINTINKVTKKADYLLQAIKESNKFFEELKGESAIEEEIVGLDEQNNNNGDDNHHSIIDIDEYFAKKDNFEQRQENDNNQKQSQILQTQIEIPPKK